MLPQFVQYRITATGAGAALADRSTSARIASATAAGMMRINRTMRGMPAIETVHGDTGAGPGGE